MVSKSKDELQIKFKFRIPQKMPSVVAHEMTVQQSLDGMLISFFEVVLPINNGTPESIQDIQERGLVAECVSKVFIPQSRYEAFVNALVSTLPIKEEPTKKKKD